MAGPGSDETPKVMPELYPLSLVREESDWEGVDLS